MWDVLVLVCVCMFGYFVVGMVVCQCCCRSFVMLLGVGVVVHEYDAVFGGI